MSLGSPELKAKVSKNKTTAFITSDLALNPGNM